MVKWIDLNSRGNSRDPQEKVVPLFPFYSHTTPLSMEVGSHYVMGVLGEIPNGTIR